MTTDYQGQSERVILLQRLISQKDSLLKASQEIEELFYQYRVAGHGKFQENSRLLERGHSP